jgi:molecular chaperone GrpE
MDKKKNKKQAKKAEVKNKECEKCEEYKAGWARAQADYQNLQKEVEVRRSEWVKLSEVQILEEFIPVYDNFKKAFGHEVKDPTSTEAMEGHSGQWENWKKGIEYIMKQFGDILDRYNIEEIKTVGEMFDPELHEAVGEEESNEEEGIIVREVDAGYKTGDKVIKCARVIVSK